MRFATCLMLSLGLSGTAWAGAALDDAGKPQRTTDPNASPDTPATAEPKLEYGVDIRIRDVFLPKPLIGLFVERTPGGSSHWGYGLDLVRRRGNLELQLGFEYEQIEPKEGVWINRGDTVPSASADYILSPDHAMGSFHWLTVEFTFLNHAPINKYIAVRYGGGAGLGFLKGSVKRIDTQCAATATNANPEPGCVPPGYGTGAMGVVSPDNPGDPEPHPYSLPPVFPVVNAIIGLQIRPTPKSVINIEGGIRTLPFFGFSFGYFFN